MHKVKRANSTLFLVIKTNMHTERILDKELMRVKTLFNNCFNKIIGDTPFENIANFKDRTLFG